MRVRVRVQVRVRVRVRALNTLKSSIPALPLPRLPADTPVHTRWHRKLAHVSPEGAEAGPEVS